MAKWSVEWSLQLIKEAEPSKPLLRVAARPEYGARVLEILKRVPPQRFTYEQYLRLSTDAYGDGTGEFLYSAWLTMRGIPDEVGRRSSPDGEVVIYQWRNPDGSNVVGTFRDGQLVAKSQAGLK